MKLFEYEIEFEKFKDREGYFFLNGVKVNYKFYSSKYGCPHLEFTTEDKKPCLLSETGYRSDFFENTDFGLFEEMLKNEIEHIINFDERGQRKKKPIKYDLEFEKNIILVNQEELDNYAIPYTLGKPTL